MTRIRRGLAMLAVMTMVLLLATPTVKAADNSNMKIGKRAEIHLSSTTRIGNLTLAPGTYRIQHRIKGDTHLLSIIELTRPYKPAVVVERHRGDVECRFEALPGKVERTAIATTKEGGVPRVTEIQIKGEGVVHRL